MEVLNGDWPRGRFRSVLFDFDGTLSLIRAGWQGVMVPMMVKVLSELNTGESRDELTRTVRDFVDELTGKQTIFQMIRLAEEVERRGGTPRDPLEYKREYLDRLMDRIRERREGLATGRLAPDEFLVAGSRKLLEALRERDLELYLASGTDKEDVFTESDKLGYAEFFNGGIYGSENDIAKYSKKMVVDRIIRENDLHGDELVVFGDGPVEIREVVRAGGISLGVASDEVRRYGLNKEKRTRLIRAGAHLILPDFSQKEKLMNLFF